MVFAGSSRPLAFAVVILVAVQAAGCTRAPPAGFTGPDPSDPRIPVPRASYRSTTDGYASQRPVAPLPWREQNQRVAPAPKS